MVLVGETPAAFGQFICAVPVNQYFLLPISEQRYLGLYTPTVPLKDLSEYTAEWNWNFVDVTNSIEQTPAHIYLLAGTYNVNLSVTANLTVINQMKQIQNLIQ